MYSSQRRENLFWSFWVVPWITHVFHITLQVKKVDYCIETAQCTTCLLAQYMPPTCIVPATPGPFNEPRSHIDIKKYIYITTLYACFTFLTFENVGSKTRKETTVVWETRFCNKQCDYAFAPLCQSCAFVPVNDIKPISCLIFHQPQLSICDQ